MHIQEEARSTDPVFGYIQAEARDLLKQVVGQRERKTIRRNYEGNGPLVWMEYTRQSDHVKVQLKNPLAETNVWLGSL